jgi:hypothetical protein
VAELVHEGRKQLLHVNYWVHKGRKQLLHVSYWVHKGRKQLLHVNWVTYWVWRGP